MTTVSFIAMADGTREDYALLAEHEARFVAGLADRVLAALEPLRGSLGGYQVTRLEHSLQSASRAQRDGRDEEYVVAALLHDIGDDLAPYTHSAYAASILQPFVRPELTWMVRHHGAFQLHYYGHHVGADPNARDRFRDSPHFDLTAEFCERYDQNCFDPGYPSLPLEQFEPLVRRVFAEPRYLDGAGG